MQNDYTDQDIEDPSEYSEDEDEEEDDDEKSRNLLDEVKKNVEKIK
jgi:hypothetical protein